MSRPDFNVTGSTVYACEQIAEYLTTVLTSNSDADIDKVAVVERHIWRFNTKDQVKRWMSRKNGGVRIAALNVRDYQHVGGRLIGNVSFAAYIFTADMYGYEKDMRAEVVAGQLVGAMLREVSPSTAYGKASNFAADNLYSDSIDEVGVAIWSVTWNQEWYLDVPIDTAELDDFLTFGLTGNLADGAPTIEGEQPLPQEEP